MNKKQKTDKSGDKLQEEERINALEESSPTDSRSDEKVIANRNNKGEKNKLSLLNTRKSKTDRKQ